MAVVVEAVVVEPVEAAPSRWPFDLDRKRLEGSISLANRFLSQMPA